MKKLKEIYSRTSKQTQNRLQEIFSNLDFTFENIYNIANSKTKKRINSYIEEWQDRGLLTGYFGMLANNVYKKTRVKNSEILELLIYSAYIEEQSKLQETELNTFKDVANYYYQEGQKEVNKKKTASIIPDAVFLALLAIPNIKGWIYNEYVQTILKYNAEQIYRQYIIDLQQQKEPDITNDIYQNIIKKQQNTRLSIKDDNISGDVDLTLIGINNMAKIEGIKKEAGTNAKVIFQANIDGKETEMCHSLNNQEFYIDKENIFNRYYGETQKNLSIRRIKCKGLVLGLNLPPISHHFHWCRSTVQYVPIVEKTKQIEYNLYAPKINKEIKQVLGKTILNKKVKKLFNKYLTKDNTVIDVNNPKAMYYSVNKDKIIVNPNHKDFNRYNLPEALSHEIIHLIERRNKLTDRINIENDISKAQMEISLYDSKYIAMFKDKKYADNMTLSDIFSSLTYDNIAGKAGHDFDYWYDIDNIKSELSANIMSAYLNNNQDTLKVINSIKSLKNIKEEVIKKYDKYTR